MKWWTQLTTANEPADFLAALAVALAVWIALAIAKRYGGRLLTRMAKRSGALWGDLLAGTVRATSLILLTPVALHAGFSVLDAPARLTRLIEVAAMLALLAQAGLWANRLIALWMEQKIEASRERGTEGATALSLLTFAARVALWSVVLLAALDQLDFDVTALVAGLGIGGVAVALAAQNILGDLFASLSIVLDKPFVVGDFIVVDGLRGVVERVGVKTTRVRSLDGELLVIPNADLMKSRIHNFRQMDERRVLFTLGVTYQTPPEKVQALPRWLREAVEAVPRTRFDRAHFKEYGDSALVFEIVYYVLDRDYNLYMDVQQAINLAIFDRFAREGVEFAYPTRTLHLQTGPAVASE
ncbi:MAG TPA: mechanosensitive ion channel family protein [Burkholderiales bacterium]|jgi:small-conductance mechanosensitive channel